MDQQHDLTSQTHRKTHTYKHTHTYSTRVAHGDRAMAFFLHTFSLSTCLKIQEW